MKWRWRQANPEQPHRFEFDRAHLRLGAIKQPIES
jgi:hypothetical protein